MSDYVKVDSSGRVSPEDDGATQRLASRQGRYFLTPTSADLMLFVRSPPVGGVAPKPRVVLAGDMSAVPMVEVVGFVNQTRRTGVLRVLAPSGERAIAFREGDVRSAVSDNPRERLGEIAVRRGFLDSASLQKVLAERGPAQLGRALVERGVLKPHDLWKCLQEQVVEIFNGMLLSGQGAFVLVEQDVEDRGAALALSTQGLLMDSIRRIDEMTEFRKRLPADDAYLVPIRPPGPELEAEERRMFELCNGSRTLADVIDASRLSEFDALKIVFHLVEGRYVSSAHEAAPSIEPSERTPDAVARLFNQVFKEIRNGVARIGVAAEFIAAANAAVPSQSEPVRHLMDGNVFRNDGTVDAAHLVANAVKSGLDANAMHAALSEVMFFLLFQAGELLDSKADEELSKRVKGLLAAAE